MENLVIFEEILDRLKELNYEAFKNYDKSWVYESIITTSPARLSLLLWIAQKFDSEFLNGFQALTVSQQNQKILSVLSAVGLCLPSDVDVIEGTADAKKQLRFWIFCLKMIYNLENSSLDQQFYTDAGLLNNLVDSSSFPNVLKHNINILPGDLRDTYKLYNRSHKISSVEDQLERLELEINRKEAENNNLPKVSDVEDISDLLGSLKENNSKLVKQEQLFKTLYKSQLSSWIVPNEGLTLSHAGPVIHDVYKHLTHIADVFNLQSSLIGKSEEQENLGKEISSYLTSKPIFMSIINDIAQSSECLHDSS